MQKRNGLIDSDKVLVTIALWIASIIIFATALTLPMLPDKVTIFYRPTEIETGLPEYYSKFNNILLILLSVIPAAIIVMVTVLKRRNRLQNNFLSIILFSIMLSLLMSSVMIYGITEQFDASSSVQRLNFHALAATIILFVLSMFCSIVPTILHKSVFIDKLGTATGYKWSVLRIAVKHWGVGAFGFLLCAIVCVFIPQAYCYIPMVVCIISHIIFLLAMANK